MMGMRSFVSLAFKVSLIDGSHKSKSDIIYGGDARKAALVDSAEANIGSSAWHSEAESPASLVHFLATPGRAFIQLIFAARGSFALLVLVGAFLGNALDECWRLSEHQSDQQESENNYLHNKSIINSA